MESISAGLQLSLYGIGITFLTLGALVLMIHALLWLANGPEETEPEEAPASTEAEHTAAIAAAWVYLNQERPQHLGARLREKPGPWWHKKEPPHR